MRILKSRYGVIAIGAVLLPIIVYFVIGAYMADTMTVRKRAIPPPQVVKLAEEQDVTLTARDGQPVAGTFLPSGASQRALIMIHGLDGCRLCELYGQFPAIASQINRAGYAVLLIDLRGHGDSPPARVAFGDTERWDVLGALDWLHARGYSRIGVLGVSLGAVVTVRTALEPDGAQGIQSMVLDSCFGDFGDVLSHAFTSETGYPSWLLPGGLLMTRLLYGIDLAAVRPIDEMPHVRGPALLMYGDHDRFVTAAQQHAMIAAKPDAEVWIAPGPDHASLHQSYPDEYMRRVLDFLKRTLA